MSMSSGELSLDGGAAKLEFQMPAYEVEHLEDAQSALLDSFTVRVADAAAERVGGSCETVGEDYRCTAEFAVPEETSAVEVECNLAESTVPNHVHILRAKVGETSQQKVFDYAFRRHEVRFRPPTAFEAWIGEAGAGALRVLAGPAQLLFLAALALAGRSRRETLQLLGALAAAQALTVFLLPHSGWEPAPRFVEAAGALTVAYLATESLLLPEAGMRWMIAAAMGVFHGLYFALFVETAKMGASRVLVGATATEAGLLALFGWIAWRLRKDFGEKLFTRVAGGLLLAVSLGWFATILAA